MDDLWRDAVTSLRSSNAAYPLRKYLEAEYDRRKEALVNDNSEVNQGKAQELRKLIKDLYTEDVDTTA